MKEVASKSGAASDDVTPEEFAEARRYAMEINWAPDANLFLVSFPDAPEVRTHGKTREEAVVMGEDAIIAWLTALRDAGIPIPPPAITVRRFKTARPDRFGADRIQQIRRRLNVSQRVFAELLNVSLSTVRSWEQGIRTPEGASLRLLTIAEQRPEALIELAAPASHG